MHRCGCLTALKFVTGADRVSFWPTGGTMAKLKCAHPVWEVQLCLAGVCTEPPTTARQFCSTASYAGKRKPGFALAHGDGAALAGDNSTDMTGVSKLAQSEATFKIDGAALSPVSLT